MKTRRDGYSSNKGTPAMAPTPEAINTGLLEMAMIPLGLILLCGFLTAFFRVFGAARHAWINATTPFETKVARCYARDMRALAMGLDLPPIRVRHSTRYLENQHYICEEEKQKARQRLFVVAVAVAGLYWFLPAKDRIGGI
jgi:hypothetical protein